MVNCSNATCRHCGKPIVVRKLPPIPGAPKGMVIQAQCECVVKAFEAEERRIDAMHKQRMIEQLSKESLLSVRERRMTFETFQQRRGTADIFKAANGFIKQWPRPRGMMFVGGVGNGKTHLAVAIMQILLKNGVSCMFVSVPELLATVRASYSQRRGDNKELDIVRGAQTAQLLVLDDLGAERISEANQEWVQEIIFRIVNWRYRHEMPIIATTNCDLVQIEDRLGSRIWSRMLESMDMIPNDATDFRAKQAGLGGED